jgi:hypothetical protein
VNRRQQAGEQRAAAFEAAVVAAQADLGAMRGPAPATLPSPPDVATLVAAELDRRAQAAEAADLDRYRCPSGGGCCYCGAAAVAAVSVDGPAPGWHSDVHGSRCEACDQELFSRIGDTDADRRIRVALRLLDLEHDQPLLAVGNPQAFAHIPVWFYEHPGAAPVWEREQRFAYIDVAALRRQWDAIVAPPPPADTRPRRRGARCGTCGTRVKIVEACSSPHSPPSDEAAGPWTLDENGVYSWEQEHCLECPPLVRRRRVTTRGARRARLIERSPIVANYEPRPAGISLDSFANARRNGALSHTSAWLGDHTLAGTTAVATQVTQPTDPGVAAAVRHSLGQWP